MWRLNNHTFPIGRNLHGFAGFEELPLQNILGLPKLRDIGIGSRGAGGWGWGEQGHAGMETVVSKKRGNCCGRMARVVVGKFCEREEAGPVGLLVVSIDSQVLLQHRIQPLRLPVRLGMESRRAVGLKSTQLQQPSPEMGCEHWIAIRCPEDREPEPHAGGKGNSRLELPWT